MTDWKEEHSTSEPLELEEVSSDSYIQRKDIKKVSHKETDSTPAYSEYVSTSRILSKAEYYAIKALEDAETSKAASDALDAYTTSLIEEGKL